MAAAWTRFKEAGLVTKTEEDTSCCYALQDKVWVEDPDGNAWEVFVVKGDTDEMGTGLPEISTSGACCVPEIKGSDAPAATAKKSCCG